MKNRQRKFLMVLPLMIIPFLAMAFWALGGGKGNAAPQSVNSKGLNMNMPKAVLKDEKGYTKMSFYDEAMTDSLKQREREKNDPFFSLGKLKDSQPLQSSLGNLSAYGKSQNGYTDPNEAKVYQKLAQLNEVMHQHEPAPVTSTATPSAIYPPGASADIDRLQQLMHGMKEENEDDTQMQQLGSMLDKIIAIQHPETMKDTGKSALPLKEINAVHLKDSRSDSVPVAVVHAGFYSADDEAGIAGATNVIRAVVPETQTIVAGSTVKLLLNDEVTVKGLVIPKNTFVYGTASLSGERLKVTVVSVRAGNNIIPVSLEVYDVDGLAGMYVPGSINRDVAKQSTDEAISGMGLSTLDPSIGAQAASAGIQAAKSLIGKNVRLVKVTVRAGYQIFLQQIN